MNAKKRPDTSYFLALFVITLLTGTTFAFIILDPFIALVISVLLGAAFFLNIKNSVNLSNKKIRDFITGINDRLDNKEGSLLDDTHSKALIERFHNLKEENSQLAKQTRQLRSVFENTPSGLILLDDNSETISMNKPAQSLLEINDHKKTNILELIESKQIKDLVKEAQSGKQARKKIQFSHNQKTLEARAIPLHVKDNGHKEFLGSLITLQDTTRLDALADVKKDFIANVSHDLRTPITSIRSLTEALLAGAKDDPKTLDRFLNELDQQVERLSFLARDILDLSKIENKNTLTKETMAIGPLLNQTVQAVKQQAENKKIKLTLDIKDGPPARIDAEQLIKAFSNLLDNCIKYTPENGKVSISLVTEKDNAKITFKDTGIGISQKSQPRIFERFYRVSKSRSVKSGGTGLGLSIVKHVVENHNGKIDVKSQLGKGSKFTVSIPV